MKKIAKMVLALMVLLTMTAARAETYPAVFVVHEIDYITDTMTLIDFNGWMWDVYGVEDFDIGDVVGAIMDGVGTEIIYDDEIQCIRCCGWLEGWK